MSVYTVELDSGIIGTVDSDTLGGQSADVFLGEIVNVHHFDEYGDACETPGVLVKVLG